MILLAFDAEDANPVGLSIVPVLLATWPFTTKSLSKFAMDCVIDPFGSCS